MFAGISVVCSKVCSFSLMRGFYHAALGILAGFSWAFHHGWGGGSHMRGFVNLGRYYAVGIHKNVGVSIRGKNSLMPALADFWGIYCKYYILLFSLAYKR